MAIITLLVTIGPMTLITAVVELITRIPDWVREKREDRMFRKTHTLFGKSAN